MTRGSVWICVHRPVGQHLAPRAARSPGARCCARTPCRARRRRPCACRPGSRSSSAVRSISGVGHAGDRLVDQQHLRVLRQQHADLQPLLLPVRQQARLRAWRWSVEADDLQHLVDARRARRRCSRVNSAAARRPCCPRSASSQFSNTVWPWNTVGRWNLRPMPSSAIRHSDSLVRSYVAARRGRRRPCRAASCR